MSHHYYGTSWDFKFLSSMKSEYPEPQNTKTLSKYSFKPIVSLEDVIIM